MSGDHPGQAGDDAIDPVAALRLVGVGQELERELHDDLARQPVPDADPHDLRVLDEPHEPAAQRVVATEVVAHAVRVRAERGLTGRVGALVAGLADRVGGDPAGLQPVGDALAVERAHHAGGVAGQEHAVRVQRAAVVAHGQGRAADRAALRLVHQVPALRRALRQPRLHETPVVDARLGLARRRGVHAAEADVHRAVAEREDPAVARQQVALARLAVPQLEVGLHERVLVPRGAVVRADGGPHGPVVAALPPDREREARADAVGRDHYRGAQLLDRALGAAPGVERLGGHADHAAVVVPQRAGDLGALQQLGAARLRVLGEGLVQRHPRLGHAVARVGGEAGPVQLVGAATAVDAQAAVADPAVLLAGGHAHADQLGHGARRQAVAADLVPGELALFQEQHVESRGRAPVRGGRAGRAGAHHDDVCVVASCSSHVHPRWEPAAGRC